MLETIRSKVATIGLAFEQYMEMVNTHAQARLVYEMVSRSAEDSEPVGKAKEQYVRVSKQLDDMQDIVLTLTGQDSLDEARMLFQSLSAAIDQWTELQGAVVTGNTIVGLLNESGTAMEDEAEFQKNLDQLHTARKQLLAAQTTVEELSSRMEMPDVPRLELVKSRLVLPS